MEDAPGPVSTVATRRRGSGRGRESGRWVPTFLAAYAQIGIVTAAEDAAGVSHGNARKRALTHPEFAEAMARADEIAADVVELEIDRRGRLGWEEPVFQRGEEVGRIRKYSDACALALMSARRPSKFRQNIKHDIGSETLRTMAELAKTKRVLSIPRITEIEVEIEPEVQDSHVGGNGNGNGNRTPIRQDA